MRFTPRSLAAIALSLAFVAGSAVAVDAAPQATGGLQYVALGDSYSSGLGLGHDVAGSPDFCHRSRLNFPHRVAAALDLRLDDVTCAGATTANVSSAPLKFGKESAAVQVGALSAKTDVVTISIGGNDLGFVAAAQSCLALGATGPLLLSKNANCRALYVKNGTDEFADRANGTVASDLEKTFAAIRHDAPNAKVFVVGYPSIFPDSANTPAGGCFDSKLTGDTLQSVHAENILPFTDVDVAYLHSVQQTLDDATSAAATEAGFAYISTLAASAKHSACAPSGERWVNGVSFGRSKDGGALLNPGSLHPDSAGAAFLGSEVQTEIVAAFREAARTSAPTPSRAPADTMPWGIAVGLIVLVVVVVVVVITRRRRAGARAASPPRGP